MVCEILRLVRCSLRIESLDLIPDFIPILGYLDDFILVPVGIALTIKMIPTDVLSECRAKAQARIAQDKVLRWIRAPLVVAAWLAIIWGLFLYFQIK